MIEKKTIIKLLTYEEHILMRQMTSHIYMTSFERHSNVMTAVSLDEKYVYLKVEF
jgi:hypothetical protein